MATPCHHVMASALLEIPARSWNRLTPGERLSLLRAELEQRSLDAFLVPTADAHASEYPPARFERRAFLTSFTGSAGTAVVTEKRALLWTDGRYFLQAAKELGEEWELMRSGEPDVPTPHDWLAKEMMTGSRVAIDPFVHTCSGVEKLEKTLAPAGIKLVRLTDSNPVDAVWGAARPTLPAAPIRKHPVRLAGKSVSQKLSNVRDLMQKRGVTHMLASMLDEVCWLFNIRGSDVPHCPVVMSYALVGMNDAMLYVDTSKVGETISDALMEAGVQVEPYEDVLIGLKKLSERSDTRIWMNPGSINAALREVAGETAVLEKTPIAMLKACKNEREIAAIKAAHIRDGLAKCQFLSWLEAYVKDGSTISEVGAGKKLEQFRAAQEGFITTSFSTIAGSGPNGAIIHYSAKEGSCGMVSRDEVFLLDSGGQYVDGTTDVTRTMHLGGNPTEYEKECFTRVLQGHIALDRAVFPEGTTGLMIDALARAPLWSMGLDYRHGTGHGKLFHIGFLRFVANFVLQVLGLV